MAACQNGELIMCGNIMATTSRAPKTPQRTGRVDVNLRGTTSHLFSVTRTRGPFVIHTLTMPHPTSARNKNRSQRWVLKSPKNEACSANELLKPAVGAVFLPGGPVIS